MTHAPSSPAGLLAAIVRASLRYRGVALALAALLAVYGAFVFQQARYDVFPEFAPPQVTIQTEAPGLAPEQVELLVTQPVENAVNGVAGVARLRSQSIQGLSVITVTFEPDSDIFRDRQNLSERLGAVAGQLPAGVQAPAMSALTSSISTALVAAMTSKTRSMMDLRTLADWTVKPRLLAVPGVAKVSVFGGDVKEIQIQLHRDRLAKYGLTVSEVLDAARKALGIRGAGFIEDGNQRIVLKAEAPSGQTTAVAATVLRREGGANLTLGDVAEVREAPEPPVGAATFNGQPAVQLMVSEQYGADTVAVTQGLERAMAELRPRLQAEGVDLTPDVFRPANFIEAATRNVQEALLIGAALVVVVVALFLANWRTSVIALAAIPLSLLAAVAVLVERGVSLNTMTLGGLAIAIGLLVDDAIIVVENVHRRLRLNAVQVEPKPAPRVVLLATLEVRSAVVYATLAIALVFLPVLTLPGLAGRLFAPLAMSYLLATMASLLVAITVTPALCLSLLTRYSEAERESRLAEGLKSGYARLLAGVERRWRWVVAAAVALTLATLAALSWLGGDFLPELREGHYIIHVSTLPGASLAESLRLGDGISQRLRAIPQVRSVGQRAGRAEKADDTWGPHYSEIDVDLTPMSSEAEAEAAEAAIRAALEHTPGIAFSVKTFLTERVEETLSGYTAAVAVSVYGPDLDTLDAEAQRVAQLLGSVPGAADVHIEAPPGTPEIAIRLRPEALARWGLAPADVLDAAQTAFKGTEAGQVQEGNRVFNVSVVLAPGERRGMADVQALRIRTPEGAMVRLDQVADVYAGSGRYAVLRSGGRRVQTITANVAGRDVASFVAEAQTLIGREAKLSAGDYVEFSGAAQAQAQAARKLMAHSLVAAVAITLMLWLAQRRIRNVALTLLNMPFALSGGVLVLAAVGGGVTLGALVGFVTLFGISLRNAVMLVSHYEHLTLAEGLPWDATTARRGAIERLVPILMTALATALGLLPLALGSGAPGREIEGPMALVILGGLFTSTALNLLLLPSLALRFGKFDVPADDGL
ncbi:MULTISPECIES: efflux RND transporter permease subunit [Burkholderiaceae]|uniref:CusA/CzcA family heavy metal efflux RND transporter n=1 Tax=Pandoraea apista TaxID=93218 RepID=A0A5E5P572_9BURK|nr:MULTISPECIES: efflux RND transporter permease subunit [Burkholderiaceae]VVG71876.1 CusA/CzcA family heavy metal efflux RND transporter [Pandoraea apista]